MSKLEDWKKKVKENALTDEHEIERIMETMTKTGEPFRLEFLQDSNDGLLLIQGNAAGLKHLTDTLNRLINTRTLGGHAHFEEGHGLTKADVSVIIQLVDDDEKNDGPHHVS